MRWLTAAALALTFGLLTVTGLELLSEFGSSRRLRAAVDRSHETRNQIQRVFSLLQDAETGQRGYVITGDRRFLEPYKGAHRDLGAQTDRLSALFAAEPAQQKDFDDLSRLVAAKQANMARALRARDEQGPAAAQAVVASGEGRAIMGDIRLVVDRMTTREARALEALAAQAQARTNRTETLVTGLFALLLLVVLATAFLVWRYLRTRAELTAAVQAVAARQQAILDSAIDGIVMLDPEGHIESVNPAAEGLFGYSAGELKGRDIALLLDLAGEGKGGFLAGVRQIQDASEQGLLREMVVRRRDGGSVPVDVSLSPVELPTGAHIVAVIRDITERRRVETMKSEFVSTVSHELRTPMTSIAGSLGLLAGGAGGVLPDKAARLIAIAQSNSQRLVRLINDILDIEKLESGALLLELAPLDLRDVAQQSIDSVRGFADELKVAITLEDGEPAPVRGDLDRLIQVVTNLLSNACKFSPSGGEVIITVDPESRLARLSVRDRGPGIPDTFRARIFSKFAQADGSDTRAKGGTGLGLAIAREIAERHGGRLWFESTPGEGATFHLDLPMAHAERADSDAVLAGPRLLIVEDDPDAAQVLREMLERDGFSADIAVTAREALAAARGGTYAAVLVDLQLPDASGIGLIRALRANRATHDLPVMVISADIARGKARGRSLDVVDWMEKPVDQDRLHAALKALQARRGGRRPVVLHVEDDLDILRLTASALQGDAEILPAQNLAAARAVLADRRPDLAILDLGLPDGSGLELLPDLGDTPVIIYSARDADADLAGQVEAVLTKTRTSLAGLARTVRRLTGPRRDKGNSQ